VSSPREIDHPWRWNEEWRKVAWSLHPFGGTGELGERDSHPHSWAEALMNLGWCLRDVGMAAAIEQRGRQEGYDRGFENGQDDLYQVDRSQR
jgi:hypothetical protein